MSKEKLAKVFHFSLQGKRDFKYDFLNENSLSSIAWKELQPTQPNFFFVEKNFVLCIKFSRENRHFYKAVNLV